jgi:tetratricopeptide (TPR) repeat protein
MVHFNLGEHLQARPLFERALSVAEAHRMDGLTAELAYELGVTAGTIGDYPRALRASEQALGFFRQQSNRYQEAYCLANIGCFYVYLGQMDRAVEVLEQAATLGRKMRIPLAEATARANLGNALRLQGRLNEALELEEQAREVAVEIGDQRLAADALIYGALAAIELGGSKGARGEALAREAVELAREGEMCPGTVRDSPGHGGARARGGDDRHGGGCHDGDGACACGPRACGGGGGDLGSSRCAA